MVILAASVWQLLPCVSHRQKSRPLLFICVGVHGVMNNICNRHNAGERIEF